MKIAIRVLIVAQNPLMREGLTLLVHLQEDMELAGAASTAQEAVRLFRDQRPNLTVMDLDLPRCGALDAIREICAGDGRAHIIGLATYGGDDRWKAALTAGVAVCLCKDGLGDTLPAMIRAHAHRFRSEA